MFVEAGMTALWANLYEGGRREKVLGHCLVVTGTFHQKFKAFEFPFQEQAKPWKLFSDFYSWYVEYFKCLSYRQEIYLFIYLLAQCAHLINGCSVLP